MRENKILKMLRRIRADTNKLNSIINMFIHKLYNYIMITIVNRETFNALINHN